LHRRDDAIREYRRAVATKPRFGPGWLGLGKVLEAAGNKSEAESCYHLAVTNRVRRLDELLTLAKFCYQHGWGQDAVLAFDEAYPLNPKDASIPFEAGMVLLDLAGRAATNGQPQEVAALRAQAEGHFAAAVSANPGFMQAHFEYGMVAVDPNVSVREFSEVVRLEPEQVQGHLNLGIAQERAGNAAQAIVQFGQVLQREPNNPIALQHFMALRPKNEPPAQ
jgi:tetratricopeptide (TPR) repeat protein